MTRSFIAINSNQRVDAVVRRVVGYAKAVGEPVEIDKNMPTMRLIVGPKTLARWKETNAQRAATDAAAAAEVHAAKVPAAAEAEAVVDEVEVEQPPADDPAPAEQAPKREARKAAPAKKAAKSTSRKQKS